MNGIKTSLMNLPNFFFYHQPKENREKYTFSFGDNGIHYTLMYLEHKKAFDFHKKDDNIKIGQDTNPYESFFEISSFKFFRLLYKNGIIQEYLIKEFIIKNKINIGKLKKHNCWLMQLENVNLSEEIYKLERKGRMLKSNKKIEFSKMMDEMDFLHPDEMNAINCNIFSVVKHKNGITTFQGFIYKINNKLYFLKKKNINYFIKFSVVSNYNLLTQMSFINKNELLKVLYEIITRKYKSLK